MADNGTRVKAADDPIVYVVLEGKRRALNEASYLNIFNDWEGIVETDVNGIEDGGAIQDGYIGNANGESYLVADTVKYRINGNTTAEQLNLKVTTPRALSAEDAGRLSDGPQLG
ncbi:hypothetical protein [Catenulispora pinisilvae]|uniref:hypothetical protein n=1 Tax=Catenulispora pinisilvae TaxID=2705253 RepID=UPI001891D0C2|nr:hypothetical protein [Catenulispora pinisilvae]